MINTAQQSTEKNTETWAIDVDAQVLTLIYEPQINIAILQRNLLPDVTNYVTALMQKPHKYSLKTSGNLEQLMVEIQRAFPSAIIGVNGKDSCTSAAAFYADVHECLSMFSCLFDAQRIGLRIDTLESPMCPRFHTDKVGVRFITTYYGPATEWLPDAAVDRCSLGTAMVSQIGCPGAIAENEQAIQRMQAGDLGLLKGELWEGNEGRGIVHRSPVVDGEYPKRLVMTCDLIY